tara:strand:+ start:178 stop:912 length:735 start_codon:yes stop_codon:yes gene_type:complete
VGKADLHIHTRISDGMASVETILNSVEQAGELDVIAITDHEDVRGGLEAQELAAKRGLQVEVVPGAEVTTRHGHLLALFIERTPPIFRSVEATIEAVHAQGGIAIAAHPMSWLTRSLSQRTIDRVVAKGEKGVMFDAIEANPSPAGQVTAHRTKERNKTLWQLPMCGGSDCHHLPQLGTGWTEFDGGTAEELRKALASGAVSAGNAQSPSLREIGLRQAVLGLAWGFSATPRKMVRRGTWVSGR